jgi:uncharacterized protein
MSATISDEEQLTETPGTSVPGRTRRSKRSVAFQKWSRIVHVYTSMISLLVVLFFAITGVTLNHPDWTFGTSGSRTETSGSLPAGWNADGKVDWLVVSEHLRSADNVHGAVAEHDGDVTDATITFLGPGYQADAFITKDGTYDLTVTTQGAMAVINDLHKGRHTGTSWRWLIDVSGIGLAVVAFTGMTLQFFLRKRRRSAFVSAGVGTIILGFLAYVAVQ